MPTPGSDLWPSACSSEPALSRGNEERALDGGLGSDRAGQQAGVGERSLVTLWPYQGELRREILAFKVRGQWAAGLRLVSKVLEEPVMASLLREIDGVMPVPSSLWGRCRGRLDLAAFLAQTLADHAHKPLIDPPRRLWGSWRKQARLALPERLRPKSLATPIWDEAYVLSYGLAQPPGGRAFRILVVDDIVTSGRTLTEYADHFRNIGFQFFAMASAHTALTRQFPGNVEDRHDDAKPRRTPGHDADGAAVF